MQKIVTITSQGQITIPASIRRLFSLDKYKKAIVKAEDKKIVIEPVPDFTSLAGILKNKAKKRKNIDNIIKEEEKVISKMIK